MDSIIHCSVDFDLPRAVLRRISNKALTVPHIVLTSLIFSIYRFCYSSDTQKSKSNTTAIMSDLMQKLETPSITYEQPTGLFIDGKWVKGKEGKTFETINPTNEKPIIAVQEAGPEGRPEDCLIRA